MSELPRTDSVLMGDAAHLHIRAPAGGPLRSRRLLRLAGDDRLVEQIRRGSEAAFEVAFERHGPAILGFCRHMLGSPEEAEDAVQHTFAAAYRDLQRGGEREIALRPWLFTIARNRCLSVLRSRREQPLGDREIATAGLADQVERRAELRELLRDVRELPEEQRAALLLAEAGDLSHAEVARVLAPRPQHRQTAVAGDREQPWLERDLALAAALEVAVRRRERVLHGVLGLFRRSEHVAAEGKDGR